MVETPDPSAGTPIRRRLDEADLDADPFRQFQQWFAEAVAAQLPLPHAMILATATPEGKPSARTVLLKGFDEKGFVFYTNYESRKGIELAANPWAALVFYWAALERQVRIEGRVEKVSPSESDAYFRSRPWKSRLSAWASPQSRVIPDRQTLESEMETLMLTYQDQEVPRPPYWGGYRLYPLSIEFWQGHPDRLHDRLRYRRCEGGGWQIERLAP
ncbi:MAG: pyridoxamine 5'-phosphate oxidase [Nitrospinota bacterium]|nr:MAG: pyridoxamine 5'-phosphate oxidase [Nitrospinota bacterium]